jgi:hypothetical protein
MHPIQIKVTLLLQTTTVLVDSTPCVNEYQELKLQLTSLKRVCTEGTEAETTCARKCISAVQRGDGPTLPGQTVCALLTESLVLAV